MNRPFLVIGNPGHRRVTGFCAEAERIGARATVVAWRDVITRPNVLDQLPPLPYLLRIEAWAENAEVERALLGRGLDVDSPVRTRSVLSRHQLATLNIEHGLVLAPRQAHDGALAVLEDIAAILAEKPAWTCLQPISAIRILFDKQATHELAKTNHIPVPESLPVCETADALFESMDRAGIERAYVKLGCGSSASCLLLVERSAIATSVTTTLELSGDKMYNSLQVRRYAKAALIERVLGFVLGEGAHVERAIDKLPAAGRHADVRMLVVGDVARFAVLRTGKTPITNLHLGGQRGDLGAYREKLPLNSWREAENAAVLLARSLGAWHLGADVAFDRHAGQPFLLEANAFGDLLPGLEHEGRSVYAWEVACSLTL